LSNDIASALKYTCLAFSRGKRSAFCSQGWVLQKFDSLIVNLRMSPATSAAINCFASVENVGFMKVL